MLNIHVMYRRKSLCKRVLYIYIYIYIVIKGDVLYSFSCIISSQIFVEKILHRMKIIYPLYIQVIQIGYITYLIVPFVDECYVYMCIISFYIRYNYYIRYNFMCIYTKSISQNRFNRASYMCIFFYMHTRICIA